MCKFKTLGLSWPPKGWDKLSYISRSCAQAISKDPLSARVTGLSYNIEPCPTSAGRYVYAFSIEGWEYNIYNESIEFPVLSFLLRERPDSKPSKSYYISEIKTQARALRLTERSAHRILMATAFFIKQIDSDQVPDFERILKLYKIHPNQRSQYNIDSERYDSLYCGLPFIEATKIESEAF
jgi:hypothetical protein